MNFKLTILKVILVIIIGIILGFFYQSFFHSFDYSALGMNPLIEWRDLALYSIIGIILTYIIWSLVQKKK